MGIVEMKKGLDLLNHLGLKLECIETKSNGTNKVDVIRAYILYPNGSKLVTYCDKLKSEQWTIESYKAYLENEDIDGFLYQFNNGNLLKQLLD